MSLAATEKAALRGGSAAEVLRAFLRLGLTSFGGPVAHLGYFRAEFVERRRWLDEPAFADIVALCQFLPGPASSQVGISLGILRAGLFLARADSPIQSHDPQPGISRRHRTLAR
jgi:chromate transporter